MLSVEEQSNHRPELMDNVDNSDKEDTGSARTPTDDLISQVLTETAHPLPDVGDRKLELDIHDLGWSGSQYDDYDVITVHGIRDDFKTAWIDKEGGWWLRNKVFKDLSARQIDYAYEVEEDSALYEVDGLKQHAIKLVTQYATIRKKLEEVEWFETEGDRPIIWVCHDLGGTIVKEALSIAMSSPKKYGKIAMLTTAIIFLSTPHRFHNLEDIEDQIHKLVLLRNPSIRNRLLKKVRSLANQVCSINREFLATKLFDRATILNILVQSTLEGPKEGQTEGHESHGEKNESNTDHYEMETPFTTFAQSLSQSFEATGRIYSDRTNHLNLVRGDEQDPWPTCVPQMLNAQGSPVKVSYKNIRYQANILSIAPPTRILDTISDPSGPKHPVVSWLLQHPTFTKFDRPLTGSSIIHFYSNGNPSIDVSKVSRQLYVDYDATRTIEDLGVRIPANSVVYFEFDRWDSRYNNISSMLLHFINVLAWRFWPGSGWMVDGLDILERMRSCSIEDLIYLFLQFRDCNPSTNELTFFISCFDQCPEDQRKWFLERVVELQSYTDKKYRTIVSTTHRNDLVVNLLPDDNCINLEKCLDLSPSQFRDEMAQEFRAALNSFIEKRPLYESFQLQIENQLNECNDFPYLGHIILTWLGHYARGAPKAKIANAIAKLSPVTAENTVNVFISCLRPERRQRAKNVFNWVKHASEPWTPRSLAEAIALHECADKDVCLDDIDSSEFMSDIERDFGGLITVQNHDIKFSHPSLYELAEIGIENTDEPAAFVHAQIATACLRYFWVENAQSKLSEFCPENLEGGVWETALDAAVIMHQRTSMAEYAVRFWPQHYKASGKIKPAELVYNLFSDKKALKYWKVPFYVLSNPFTRLQRSYISPLPTFASLGLEDLVDGQLKAEGGQPSFKRNCSLAITEAARAGNIKIVQLLLEKVVMEEDELSNALFWSAASGHGDIVDILLKKIPDLKTFCWPENLMYRAASMGFDSLLAAMQQSDCNMNEPVNDRRKATPLVVATYRNRASTVKFMLQLDLKPDLSIRDQDRNNVMWYAAKSGDPRMVDVLVKGGATVDERCGANMKPVQLAVRWCKHKALELLIAANADFSSGEQGSDAESDRRLPLVVAANMGSTKCVSVLLGKGVDPNVECASGTALYNAVSGNHIDIVRMLLQNDPAAKLDVSPSGKDKLLIRAVCTRNPALVSLLIEHGAVLDFVDPNANFSKTPLSRAASEGDMEMVKLLLKEGAGINYTEGHASDSPLFSAIYNGKVEVAKLLLSENGDATWTDRDGWNSLHAAYDIPGLIPDLLQKNIDINSMGRHGTVLHMASRDNHPASIAILLKQIPKPDLEVVYSGSLSNDVGCTALLLACKNRNPECVELLLKAGADRHFQKENGDDAISVLLDTKEDPERAAKCLELLVFGPYKMDVHKVDQHGNTLLHKIGTQTPASMVQILVKTDVPLTQRNNDGYTPLAVAVKNSNEPAAKCLIEHGADVNVLSPRFGSILHIACASGSLNLVKLLLDAGADREAVDPSYGISLLYTALSIRNGHGRGKMVRYLVDVANVSLNQRGGYYAYPIIRAAYMAGSPDSPSTMILKFLTRRKVDLNVADDQGRRAVHLASMAGWEHGLKALVDAGANIDVKDHAGRLAMHFAASALHHDCMTYLLSKFQDKYIHEIDYDNWTPLLWAARSGSTRAVDDLVERKADLWARGYTYGTGSDSEWSALKLARFYGRYELQNTLRPTEYTRDEPEGVTAIWDKSFHKSRLGDTKWYLCSSCQVSIRGPRWECIECTNDFSLCFKCFRYKDKIHKTDHSFEEIGPFFAPNQSYDDDSDLEEDGVAKERAKSPEQEPGNDEETVHGDDAGDAGAATSSDETVDDIEFELETPDVII